MNPDRHLRALQSIAEERDANARALLLAAMVSNAFREAGFELVVVGGSAIEFYTDGAYMSGDIDLCWLGPRVPEPSRQAEVMASFAGARGGPRSWKIAGLFVDLLGTVETYARRDYSVMQTPLGPVVLQPVEDLIVERVFAARCWTGPNPEGESCAAKLLAAALGGGLHVDWSEVERIASLPAYACSAAVAEMKREVAAALENEPPRGSLPPAN